MNERTNGRTNEQVDDVVNAAPVHLFCGMWGLIAAGLFSSKFGYASAYSEDRADDCAGLLYGGGARTFGANLVFLVTIVSWVGLTTLVIFVVTKLTIGIRVSKRQEMAGMVSERDGVWGDGGGDDVYFSNGRTGYHVWFASTGPLVCVECVCVLFRSISLLI